MKNCLSSLTVIARICFQQILGQSNNKIWIPLGLISINPGNDGLELEEGP